ncbi:MAG: glycosyltransferase family 4 protein [Bacteroidetes bacterium]|jgi:glycosyltransferase involved in cell wall biosynthesis|nr:MAG: glycosyltransferase family 4 protein [Bacteroidota bacterium]
MEKGRKKVAIIENHELGIYSIRHDLVLAIAQKYDVSVLTEIDDSFKNEALGKVVRFIDVGKSVMNPLTAIKYNRRLRKALREIQPDVCLTFTIRPAIYGNMVTSGMKIPTISTITGTGPLFDSRSLSYTIARQLYKWVLKKTRFVFFPNYDDLEAFIQAKYIKREQAKRVPGSGVNYEKFAPMPYTRGNDGKFVFLYISRLIKDKGIMEYVEAASILKPQFPRAEFHVIGPLWTGNTKSLTVTAKERDEWIEKKWIIYHDKQKDIRPYVADADCVVMPSYREGMSNVLLEAASMARPLIATNVTGCRDIVEDGMNGLLCKVKDGKDLAEKMKRMMSMPPEQREQMGKKGREKMIREFDKKLVIQIYLQAIDEVANG